MACQHEVYDLMENCKELESRLRVKDECLNKITNDYLRESNRAEREEETVMNIREELRRVDDLMTKLIKKEITPVKAVKERFKIAGVKIKIE